eukprot:tig00021590_g22766.t1
MARAARRARAEIKADEESDEDHLERAPSNSSAGARAISVFVSSTFRDGHAERDAINHSAVPRLRQALAGRGLFLNVVDLRWGITEKSAQGGDVVRLCLKEVSRCSYFIAFLKWRYGWAQPEGGQEDSLLAASLRAAEREFPYVRAYPHSSVTELEVLLGAFLDPLGRERLRRETTRFYFAAAAGPGEGGAEDAGEGPWAAARLEALKRRVAGAGLAVPLPAFGSPAELAAAVHDDLLAARAPPAPPSSSAPPSEPRAPQMVLRDHPRAAPRTWLEEARLSHEAFAAARRRVYAAGALGPLDEHAAGRTPEALLIAAPSGSGKSALLANWAESWGRRNPRDALILHFVGGSARAARPANLVQRVVEEVRGRFPRVPRFDAAAPEHELLPRFAAWLPRASSSFRARLVLCVDAVDQFLEQAGADPLAWLPRGTPALRLLLSCAPGEAAAAARLRRCREVSVAPLGRAEREELVRRDLEGVGKALAGPRLARLLEAPQCAVPLFAVVLLEQLKAHAVHETLDRVLDGLLACRSATELYAGALARWSAAFSEPLVRTSLCCIHCSREGLAEDELKLLLGVGREVPAIVWAEFLASAASLLIDRDGLLGFFHRAAAEAVEGAFGLGDAEARRGYHALLGAFFAGQPPSERQAEEGPFQLAAAGEGERAAGMLSDVAVMRRLRRRRTDVVRLWVQIGREAEAAPRLQAALHAARRGAAAGDGASREQAAEDEREAGRTLHEMGRLREAAPFLERALELLRGGSGRAPGRLGAVANDLANLYEDLGEYEAAGRLYGEALRAREAAHGAASHQVAETLHDTARLHLKRAAFADAEPLLRRALGLRESSLGPAHSDVAESLLVLAELLEAQNRFAEAEPLFTRALEIREGVLGGEHPETAEAMRGLAELCREQGRFAQAEELYRRALGLQEGALGEGHPDVAETATHLALVLGQMGRYPEAHALAQRALELREGLLGRGHADWAESACVLAELLEARGLFARAEPLFAAALEARERALGPEHPDTLTSYGELCRERGELDRAEALYRRALGVRERVLGEGDPDVAETANDLAAVLGQAGRYAEAEALCRRALGIRVRVFGEGHPEVADSWALLAALCQRQGRLDDAEALYTRALEGRERALGAGHPEAAQTGDHGARERAGGAHPDLADALLGYGSFLLWAGRPAEAPAALERALGALEEILGAGHAETRAAAGRLAEAWEALGRGPEAAALRARYPAPPPA